MRVGSRVGQLTVEQAMKATLELWAPEYIVAAARRYAEEEALDMTGAELEEALAKAEFPFRPRGVTVAKDFEDWPVEALPHIQIISPSWAVAGGSHDGRTLKYQLQVACLVGAQTSDDTRFLRACYEDAIIGICEQQQSLGGVAGGVDLVGGGPAQFTEVSGKDSRTFQGSIAVVEVTMERAVTRHEGPVAPAPEVEGVPPGQPAEPTLAEEGASVELDPEPLS
jgi:hypothetical protein